MNTINSKTVNSKPINPPLEVILKRNSIIESRHIVHAVITDKDGRVRMHAGNHSFETFIRSSLKPFQVLICLSCGNSKSIDANTRSIAIACGSHSGSVFQAREAFKLLWDSSIDINNLKCPVPKGMKSNLQHNCSGKHSAFLVTCKRMGWPITNYLDINHPLQRKIKKKLGELLLIAPEEIISAVDNCGAPTFYLKISQMALLYARLGFEDSPEFMKIKTSISSYPELIAGKGKFDTELIMRSKGQLISKGGGEGVQCITRIGEGIGIAIKVEDGSKRAKHAVALHILKKLEWISPSCFEELQSLTNNFSAGVELEVSGRMKFQEI